jgi:eukaryotic-like serine/threonine-protein kinase
MFVGVYSYMRTHLCYTITFRSPNSAQVVEAVATMAQWSVALFGPLRITVDGQLVTGFGYDKVRALFAYLLLETERPSHRDALAALLWPDAPTSAARKSLRNALVTLRQALGEAYAITPLLLVTRDSAQRNPNANIDLDVERFNDLFAQVACHDHPPGGLCAECAQGLAEATALYQGDFLQQISVPESLVWEEWVTVQRERLHRNAVDALTQLIVYHEARCEDEPARQYAWRTLALEPWDETAHRCLMRVLARNGQRNAALAQYERCRRVLAEEFQAEPIDETTALYEAIRAGVLTSSRSGAAISFPEAAVQAPAYPADLIGEPNQVSPAVNPLTNGYVAPPHDFAAQLLRTEQQVRQEAAHVQPARQPSADRNRSRMLTKVRRFWIEGILEQSLHGAALIELGLTYEPQAVERPWSLLMRYLDQPPQAIPLGTPIGAVYDALDGELLILGAPGSGKTTTLLDLARELIDRAERDATLPIPVVFNLSSWAAQRGLLAEWLVEELSARYQVPRRIGRTWIENEQVLPLLDGLDEVALEHRAGCVEAINRFRDEHWLLDVVVCSRSADYAVLTTKLRLEGAVMAQPLAPKQVDSYLARGGERLAALRAAVQEDETLRELADTPLMLSIMALAYQGTPIESLRARMSLDEGRQHLFDTYIQHMLVRRSHTTRYTPQQILNWLAWLAQNMAQRSQTLFFIEGLQPDWLGEQASRTWYRTYVGVTSFGAALVGMITTGVREGLIHSLANGLVVGSASGLMTFLVCAVLFGLAGNKRLKRGAPQAHRWWFILGWVVTGMATGLCVGIAGSFFIALFQGLRSAPPLGLFGGILAGFNVGLVLGLMNDPRTIKTTEALFWSWHKATAAWPGKLALSLVWGCVVGVFRRLNVERTSSGFLGSLDVFLVGLATVVVTLFILAFTTGLSSTEIETKVRPNQGIQRSLQQAIFMGSLFGLTLGLVYGVVSGLSYLAIDPERALTVGFAYGVANVASGLTAALIYGGLACIQHVVLRFLLWHSGAMPLKYARFLDTAADLLFLRKVGGGYIFVHRLLLEHFATHCDTAVLAPPQPKEPAADVRGLGRQ